MLKRLLTVLAAGLLLSACAPTPPPALVTKTVKTTARVDPAAPCSDKPAAGAPSGAPSTTAVVTFDRVANRIALTGGENVTLADLSKAVKSPAALRELAPGEWLLSAPLEIAAGASLDISAPDVRWLKISSGKRGYASIKALGGSLSVSGSCITSWDVDAKKVDDNVDDGRAFLLARDKGGRLIVDNGELRYLGFGSGESYGLSWRLGATGKITHSVVSHLYYGLYTYQVAGLEVTDDEFHDNIVYGIDPHTGSKDLKILRNVVHDNGKHGIILAEDCTNSVISDNVVYNNGHHGIVLYLRSNGNTVENNDSFGNLAQGLNVNEASSNTIRGNRMYNNSESGMGIGQGAKDNVLERNDVRGNKQDGVRLFSEAASTTLTNNIIGENGRYGVYVDSDSPFKLTGNTIFGSRVGVLLKGAATASEGSNQMYGNNQANIKNG